MTPEQLISDLNLAPLPDEGGMFFQHFRDEFSTAIYFLVRRDDFSALHRLQGTEIYHFYGGAPLRLLLLAPDGGVERFLLGSDTKAGQRPAAVVPSGYWQGSETSGDWSLVGTTMAPGFAPERFELGDRGALTAAYPDAEDEILRLTRVV